MNTIGSLRRGTRANGILELKNELKSSGAPGNAQTNECLTAVTKERLLRGGPPIERPCLLKLAVDCVLGRWLCGATRRVSACIYSAALNPAGFTSVISFFVISVLLHNNLFAEVVLKK